MHHNGTPSFTCTCLLKTRDVRRHDAKFNITLIPFGPLEFSVKMPIEDIDFLEGNSELDSTLFFLDSASRDHTVFPNPAEYVVQFSESIKLVVGIDILDATIPASMYVVDSHSDSLPVITLSRCSTKEEPIKLFDGINSDPFTMLMVSTNNVFCFLVDEIDLGKVLLAYDSSHSTQINNSKLCVNVIIVRNTQMRASDPNTNTMYHFASSDVMEELATSVNILLCIKKSIVKFERGNYDIVSLMSQVATSLRAVCITNDQPDPSFQAFDVISTSSSTVALQGKYAITNSTNSFILDMRSMSSSISSVLGFSTLPLNNAVALGLGYCSINSMKQGFGSVMSDSIMSSCFSNKVYINQSINMVVAPGIANLLGVRYIVLRCPEIEQHLYSGMTFGSHSTGIGVFKLPSGNEVSNLRFDFVSLVRKPFHPIGRVSRLTFRFEMNDGSLYDFKGINTQLLMAVKFLSPGKRVPITKSVLNPDYNPDFLKYMSQAGMDEALIASEIHQIGLLQAPTDYMVSALPTNLDEDHDSDDSDDDHIRDSSMSRNHAQQFTNAKRQDIAMKLLQEQDKYDYPSRERDTTAWRTPSI